MEARLQIITGVLLDQEVLFVLAVCWYTGFTVLHGEELSALLSSLL